MTKEDLENKKLQLEIKKLGTPWYRNIEFWKVLIPTLAVLFSLYFTFGRGILDAEKSKLEIQKEQLKLDISQFEIKSKDLSAGIVLKDSIRTSLELQIAVYEKQKNDLINKILLLNKKLGNSNLEISNITNEKARDKQYYLNELLKQYNIEKEKLNELDNLKSALNKKTVSIASMTAEIEFLSSKTKLNEYDKNNLEIKKLTAIDKALSNSMNTYKTTLDKLDEKYAIEKKRIESLSKEDLRREFETMLLKLEVDNK